jgi:phage shock protein E
LRLISALLVLVTACAPAVDGEISAEALLSRLDGEDRPVVLDVRTPDEYASGHVPGAINIPHDQIRSRLSELGDHQKEDIVVYCKSGRRAGVASEALTDAGFRVMHLQGDMMGWTAAGHPEEDLTGVRAGTP